MKRPNIVFLIADQHRWDLMGYESGNGTTITPNLDALACRGTRFHSAYCTAPLCSPSRAAIALGRYGMMSGCYTNLHEVPANAPTFVSQLRSSGYATAAFGKTHYEIHAYDSDLTSEEHRMYMHSLGFDHVCEYAGNDMFRTGIRDEYERCLFAEGVFDDVLAYYRRWHYFMDAPHGDKPFTLHPFPFEERYHGTAFAADRAVDWLSRQSPDVPYFMHVGFSAPHSPIDASEEYLELYRGHAETSPWNASADDAVMKARTGYRALITQIDRHVGRIIEAVRARGDIENTVFVYTADHGEMAGDHGRDGKTCFFEGSVRVPLIIAGSSIVSGVSNALVELIDIGKTICDITAAAPHALDQGKSLMPLLRGDTDTHRETVYCEMGCDRMLFDGRYKLMCGDPYADTRSLGKLHLDKPVTIHPSPVRLYDMAHDAHEVHDAANDNSYIAVRAMMMEKLIGRMNENLQPGPLLSRGEYRPLHAERAEM